MWTSVQRRSITAALMPSARTPWSHTNASASQATKETANIVKVKVKLDKRTHFHLWLKAQTSSPFSGRIFAAHWSKSHISHVDLTYLWEFKPLGPVTGSIRASVSLKHNSLVQDSPGEGGETRGKVSEGRKGKARCRVLLCDEMKWSSKFPTHVAGEN